MKNDNESSDEGSEDEENTGISNGGGGGGGLRPYSSVNAKTNDNGNEDSSSSSSSESDEDEEDGEVEGTNMQNDENLTISNVNVIEGNDEIVDPVFRLIQQEYSSSNIVMRNDVESNNSQNEDDQEGPQNEDFLRDQNQKGTKKRSNELLYLDPEEQDPFLVNKSNRSWKKPQIGKVGPSEVLERVKQFLPQFEASNEEIHNQINAGANVDIEALQDEQQYIEMNLALGLLEDEENNNDNINISNGDENSAPNIDAKKLIQML